MLIKEIFMVCNYCGATIIGNIKQCPDCGMPTDNLTVPIPAPIKTKKVRKKEIDPNEIPKNKRAIPSIILTGLSGLISLIGIVLTIISYSTANIFEQALFQGFEIAFSYIFSAIALAFFSNAMPLAVAGAIVSLLGVLRKGEKQTAVFICLCASVLAFVLAFCMEMINTICLFIPLNSALLAI